MLRSLSTDLDMIGSRYKFIEEIGSGAFGSVSKAYDLEKKIIVALKKLKDAFSHDFNEERIINEITILQKLQHPNIVKIYDIIYSKSDHNYYISMEYCEQDLITLLETNKLQPQHIKYFMLQILEALKYLNAQHFVHQDIKPHNILVQNGEKIKIADFGLAVSYPHDSKADISGGTPSYNSPEKLFGATQITPASDIWSTGVLFYQLITKSHVFSSSSSSDQVIISILNICGAPDLNKWSEVKQMKYFSKFIKYANPNPTMSSKFNDEMIASYGNIITDIRKMLNIIPSERPTAEELLKSGDFKAAPASAQITEEFHMKLKNTRNIILDTITPIARPLMPKPALLLA